MDKEKIMEGVKLILEGIGEDPTREGLLETPDRIARMYEELAGGSTSTGMVVGLNTMVLLLILMSKVPKQNLLKSGLR